MSTNYSPGTAFVEIGTLGAGGFITSPATHENDDDIVYVSLQDSYSVSFDVFVDFVHPDLWALVFGPQFALAQQFSRYTPFWYLKGDE